MKTLITLLTIIILERIIEANIYEWVIIGITLLWAFAIDAQEFAEKIKNNGSTKRK